MVELFAAALSNSSPSATDVIVQSQVERKVRARVKSIDSHFQDNTE